MQVFLAHQAVSRTSDHLHRACRALKQRNMQCSARGPQCNTANAALLDPQSLWSVCALVWAIGVAITKVPCLVPMALLAMRTACIAAYANYVAMHFEICITWYLLGSCTAQKAVQWSQ